MYTYSFEKLEVWKLARMLTKDIYKTSRSFPDEEKFGMVSQIRRASVSISTNIAEGSGRITGKEQARFSEIAFSSLLEVLNLLLTSLDLEYIKENEMLGYRPKIEEIGNKLNSLRNSQLKRP